jgi:hypothetical protein
MTAFEIITIVITFLIAASGTVGLYVKIRTDNARVDERIKSINREILQREIGSLVSEKINREDHQKIIEKIDHLIDIYVKK